MNDIKDQADKLSLEDAMKRLDEITSIMEKETLPLNEMMSLFKEGKLLEEKCKALLDQAEKEIMELKADE